MAWIETGLVLMNGFIMGVFQHEIIASHSAAPSLHKSAELRHAELKVLLATQQEILD